MEIDMEAEEEACSFSPAQLLQLAEDHLRLRNYSFSSQYALESLHSGAASGYDSPIRRRASLIVAVSDVLVAADEALGSATNWYSVLGVDTFCADLDAIRLKFKSLLLILGPVRENFAQADEAINAAWKAWMVLSNPEKKSELDAELAQGIVVDRRKGKNNVEEPGSFWTFCPYCYYMYEYARAYEGYSLRCQNESCRRAFQGASIFSSPPGDLEQDECFDCFGCFPLGFSKLQEASNGTFAPWSPFVSMFPYSDARKGAKIQEVGVAVDDVNTVDISDDSEESGAPARSRAKRARFGNQKNGKRVGPNSKNLLGKSRMARMDDNPDLSNVRVAGEDYQGNLNQDEGGFGFQTAQGMGSADEFGPNADLEFVENDGEIFVQLPSDDTF